MKKHRELLIIFLVIVILGCVYFALVQLVWSSSANAEGNTSEQTKTESKSTESKCLECEIQKSSADPNIALRNRIKMKRMRLINLRGFYARERNELLAEEKFLDKKIKEMQNEIDIHTLGLNPPPTNPGAIFGGYAEDGKEIWITPIR